MKKQPSLMCVEENAFGFWNIYEQDSPVTVRIVQADIETREEAERIVYWFGF